MEKRQWNKCSCGAVIDSGEQDCPNRRTNNDPAHRLQEVELNREEIKKLKEEKRVWTKHVAALEEWLSQ